jgi:hypothetical protein
MQVKGAEASAKPGATAQRWSHGQFNDLSGWPFHDFDSMSGLPENRHGWAFYEYTPFCNGPGDVKSPGVIVTPPSSRFCPWLALRPPHYAVRSNGEPI